jgi:hypothetical protein
MPRDTKHVLLTSLMIGLWNKSSDARLLRHAAPDIDNFLYSTNVGLPAVQRHQGVQCHCVFVSRVQMNAPNGGDLCIICAQFLCS